MLNLSLKEDLEILVEDNIQEITVLVGVLIMDRVQSLKDYIRKLSTCNKRRLIYRRRLGEANRLNSSAQKSHKKLKK